jgi:hypothetical protein
MEEFCDGYVLADYDRRGRLLGVALLAPCEARIVDKIAPDRLPKAFIRKSIPHRSSSHASRFVTSPAAMRGLLTRRLSAWRGPK